MIPPWLTPRRALVGLAAVCLVGAVVAILPAWLVPGFVLALSSSSTASSTLVLVAAALGGLYGLRVLAADGEDERSRRPTVQFPSSPEVAVHEDRRVVGAAVNGAAGSEDADEAWRRRRHRRRAHETLRAAAVDAVAEATGCGRETAARLVAEGRWTDRPRARAYLADDASVRPPLRTRVRDWAAGEQTERAVRETVSAVLALRDGDADARAAELRAEAETAAAAAESGSDAAEPRPADAERRRSPQSADDAERRRTAAVAEADGGERPRSRGGERP